MRITIDNLDGLGTVDYTASLRFDKEARIKRQLNKPVLCTFSVVTGFAGLRVPLRGGRVVVSTTKTVLFTGYVATLPALEATGVAESQDCLVAMVTAVSDEVLLDASVAMTQNQLVAQTAQDTWNALGAVSLATALPVQLSKRVAAAGRVEIKRGARWSEEAGALAKATASVYRVMAGEVAVSALGENTHAVQADDPGLRIESVNVEDLRWLAQDVTVCGREEPTAYVTELFEGDGVTTAFTLSRPHFSPAAAQKTTMDELFQGTSLDPRLWATSDPGGQIALTANGLTCAGGSGRDAQTTVTAVQQLEMGGSITVEGNGVQIGPGSAGRLLGLYTGAATVGNCLAGFAVTSAGSVTSVAAIVNGSEAGASFTALSGHLYTLRVRVFSPEMQRVRQSYVYQQAEVLGTNGGQVVASSGMVVLEVQDVTSGQPAPPMPLFSGLVGVLPTSCTLAVLSSGNLMCSIRSVQCSQAAPLWVTAGLGGSTPAAQYIGTAAEGGACQIASTGTVTFYPAALPAAGELVTVIYRLKARAVARQANSGSASSPMSMWVGTVDGPIPWSSADCENAAAALVSNAESAAAAWKGTYNLVAEPEGQDLMPGDALVLHAAAGEAPLVLYVREVLVALSEDRPETVRYTADFTNVWAESLCIQLSASIPADVVLPQEATDVATTLQNLSSLTVAGVTTTTLTLNTGLMAPANGGFEVRRRENTFGPGVDSDLVLRTSTTTISIPRLSAVEQYYVRMYDDAVPPHYSSFSAAVFLNIPT